MPTPNTPLTDHPETEQTNQTTPPVQTTQPPKKIRRVGTVAFGLVLVAAGALMIVHLLVPNFDLLTIVKFSPAILIVLGVEVLVYAARPDVVVKYDFLSMIACAFILLVVGGASAFSQMWVYYGPAYDTLQREEDDKMTEAAYAALNTVPELKNTVESLYARVYFNDIVSLGNSSYTAAAAADTEDADDTHTDRTLYVTLRGDAQASPTAFAETCRQVIAACEAANVPVNHYSFTDSREEDINELKAGESYALTIEAAWATGMTADQLAERVATQYFANGAYYNSAADRDNDLKAIAREEIIQEYANEHDGEYPGDGYIEEQLAARFPAPTPVPELPEAKTATAETAAA